MKILLVSSFLPYPLDSGGHVRLYNLLKELKKHHKITLVCEKRSSQGESDIAEVKKYCEGVYTVPRKKQWSLKNILKSAVSRYPFLLIGHTSDQMKKRIVSLLNEATYDLIHVETFYVYQNLPKTYLPKVLVEHNIEYKVYEKFAATAPVVLRPFLAIDIQKIKYWEEKFWKMATKIVVVSQEEKKTIPGSEIVSNGVDITKFRPKADRPMDDKKKKKEKRILFIGNFKWIQNQNAAAFILREIWPTILSKFEAKQQDIKLWIVGRHIPYSIKAQSIGDVLFDESAPSQTEKIYQKADILLAPIIVGGGTSYKILEAMASGVPVVTTKLGVEGLLAENKKHALVGQTAEELAKLTVSLLENKDLYEKLSKDARVFVENNYAWGKIAQDLQKVYASVITTV